MKKIVNRFANEEFGNAVIDWTVLMAGMVLMAIAVVATITDDVDTATEDSVDRVEQVGFELS